MFVCFGPIRDHCVDSSNVKSQSIYSSELLTTQKRHFPDIENSNFSICDKNRNI